MRILVVGKTLQRTKAMACLEKSRGIGVDVVDSASEALEHLALYDYSAVLTALDLPDLAGEDFIWSVRKEHAMPLIAACADFPPQRRAQVLDAGADDVVPLHVDGDELVARVRAVVRRQKGYTRSTLQAGPVELNMHSRELHVAGTPVPLTPKEYELLELLFLRKGIALKKEAFISHLYGSLDGPDPKTIDVLVCRLRKKLSAVGASDFVGTVRGAGYIFREARLGQVPASRAYADCGAEALAAA